MSFSSAIKHPSFSLISVLIFSILFLLAFSTDITLLNFISNQSIDIRILVMFLLAEPHFAMTIPLLWGYRIFFRTEKLYFIYIPCLIIITSALVFYINIAIYSYLFLLANIYHVNRQSRGMLLIQGKADLNTANLYEVTLHLSCLLIFLSRFYLESNSFIVIFSAFFFTLLLSILIWRAQSKEISISKVFVALQGYLIFLPAIYFQDLILAFAVGISIHYLQYLAISFPVCKKSFGFSFIPLILFLLGYSLLSTGSLSGFFSNEKISLIIFIPTSLQLLHFYFDGFIWRKSNTIVRETLSRASF
jgi:hypothetical protein